MSPRVLHPSDAAIYRALRLRGLREEPRAFSPTFEEEAGLTMEEVSAALTPTGERLVLGLFDGEQLVGLAGVARERPSKLAHRATIWGVYVAPEARGRGAGKVLMQAAVEHAYALPGIRQLYLSVQPANSPARRLYESLGFEAIGVERGFMIVDGVAEDELHMAHYGRQASLRLGIGDSG